MQSSFALKLQLFAGCRSTCVYTIKGSHVYANACMQMFMYANAHPCKCSCVQMLMYANTHECKCLCALLAQAANVYAFGILLWDMCTE